MHKLQFFSALFCLCFSTIVSAQTIDTFPYSLAAAQLDGLVNFEPPRGLKKRRYLTGTPRFGCVRFGERFKGQNIATIEIKGNSHDALEPRPSLPLTITSAGYPQNLLLNNKDGELKSVVLHGVGANGLSKSGSGEGAISLIFDQPQEIFGFRYVASSDTSKIPKGLILLHFFDFDGHLISRNVLKATHKDEVAFKIQPGTKPFLGVSITNTDPGGVGFDDFVMRCEMIPIG